MQISKSVSHDLNPSICKVIRSGSLVVALVMTVTATASAQELVPKPSPFCNQTRGIESAVEAPAEIGSQTSLHESTETVATAPWPSVLPTPSACMSGSWTDNFSYSWELNEGRGGRIYGRVYFGNCGPGRAVVGSLSGNQLRLTATGGPADCCDFEFVGTISNCDSASGSWSHLLGPSEACTASGSFVMTRTDGGDPGPEDPDAPGSPRR